MRQKLPCVCKGLEAAIYLHVKCLKVLINQGVQALGPEAVARTLQTVQSFAAFTPDNDPHGEHDFGSFEIAGEKLFFKVDYYDANMEYGSPDPADPAVTTRVLTIMLAEEY